MGSKTNAHSDNILGLLQSTPFTEPETLWVSLTKTGGAGDPTNSSAGNDMTTNQGRRSIVASNGWTGPQAPSTGTGRAIVNANAITWSSWNSGDNGASVSGFNVWDSSTATGTDNRLYWGTLTTDRTMNTGETATFAAGDLEIIED